MLILIDVEAAFPSLSRESMMEILDSAAFPPGIMQVIKCLYHNNCNTMKLEGQLFPSSSSTGGVRQGFPLPPILFYKLC